MNWFKLVATILNVIAFIFIVYFFTKADNESGENSLSDNLAAICIFFCAGVFDFILLARWFIGWIRK